MQRARYVFFFVCSIILISGVIGGFVFGAVRPARAAAPTAVVSDIPGTLKWLWERVKDAASKSLIVASKTAADIAVTNMIQRVAYDTATFLASGGEGQKPLFFTEGWGPYLKQVGESTVADFVGILSEEVGFDALGLNLCEPNINVRLFFTMGILQQFTPPTPRCTFKQITDNWSSLSLVSSTDALRALNEMFRPGGNDLGAYLTINDAVTARIFDAEKAAENDRREAAGFRSVTTKSGAIKTPGTLVEEEAKELATSGHEMTKLHATGAYITGAAGIFATVFTTTFLGKLQQRLFTEGLVPPELLIDKKDLLSRFGGGTTGVGRPRAQASFASLVTPVIQESSDFDLLGELASCSAGEAARGPYNCAIDQGMLSALREDRQGKPLTVREARTRGLLQDWALVPSQAPINSTTECIQNRVYCHSNLTKLRRLRIIPVGWEFAAAKSPLPSSDRPQDRPVTLYQVMDQFDNPDSDFYHLIDPNWILKAPVTQCRRKAFGEFLEAPGSNRRTQTCVDTPSCLAEDSEGNCTGGFGYCLEEEKTWRMKGKSCQAQYAGCEVLTRERNRKQSAFIASTLEACNGDASIDCRLYAAWQEGGEWTYGGSHAVDFVRDDPDGEVRLANTYFLNGKTQECKPQAEGCSELKPVDAYGTVGQPSFLRVAPSYLHCYDGDKSNDDRRCADFAKQCTVAGCEQYTPVAGGASVTGVPSRADQCPVACVGFEEYAAQPLWWDATPRRVTRFLSDFIPKTARECPLEAVGCEEYTNLDTVVQGGEGKEFYTELRQCVKPGEGDRPFYTWEGTDESGYQLRTWRLLLGNLDAGPCTNVNPLTNACIDTPATQAVCLEADLGSNPNCRRLYNQEGQIFYRLADRTIQASAECHPYRKTALDVTGDGVANEQDCPAGHWDAERGECRFQAIPQQSLSCKPAEVGCRLFKGPRAGASERLFFDTFEDEHSWVGRNNQVSADAAEPGGHSLMVIQFGRARIVEARRPLPSRAGTFTVTLSLKRENTHGYTMAEELTFMIGNQKKTVDTRNRFVGTWQQISVGPFTFNQEQENRSLVVSTTYIRDGRTPASPGDVNALFIDNIELRDSSDVFSIINNSWVTPAQCTPETLHCSAYRPSSRRETVTLTGFRNTCDPVDVGCMRFKNGFNLSGNVQGASFNRDNNADLDDVVIPAPRDIFLLNTHKASCRQEDKGCQAFGAFTAVSSLGLDTDCTLAQECADEKGCECRENNGIPLCVVKKGERACGIETVFRINDPNQYGNPNAGTPGILCQAFESRCEAFTDTKGDRKILKNPTNRFCEWRDAGPAVAVSGWYRTGTQQSCYAEGPDVLYASTDPNYQGVGGKWVGMCPSSADQCTAFTAPAVGPAGEQKHFIIDDDENIDDESCSGGVSVEQGCVLFFDAQSSDPVKWSVQASYARASLQGSKQIPPVACSGRQSDRFILRAEGRPTVQRDRISLEALGYNCVERPAGTPIDNEVMREGDLLCLAGACQNDANRVIKVTSDRQCSSWLSCVDSQKVWDPATRDFREVCSELARCAERDVQGKCTRFDNRLAYSTESGVLPGAAEPALSEKIYRVRNTTWWGTDWSGYTIPNTPPIELFRVVPTEVLSGGNCRNVPEGGACRAGDQRGQCRNTICVTPGRTRPFVGFAGIAFDVACRQNDGQKSPDGTSCGLAGRARCHSGICLVENPLGYEGDYDLSCRGFPEEDSPFPTRAKVLQGFERVNTLTVGEETGLNLCRYTKLEYGSEASKLYAGGDVSRTLLPKGLCQGGVKVVNGVRRDMRGASCEVDEDCGGVGGGAQPGSCAPLSRSQPVQGWEGICLERVPLTGHFDRNACLTWLPVDRVGTDIFNNVESAAWQPPTPVQAYCLDVTPGSKLSAPAGQWCAPCNALDRTARERLDVQRALFDGLQFVAQQRAMVGGFQYEVCQAEQGGFLVVSQDQNGCQPLQNGMPQCRVRCVPRGSLTYDGESCTAEMAAQPSNPNEDRTTDVQVCDDSDPGGGNCATARLIGDQRALQCSSYYRAGSMAGSYDSKDALCTEMVVFGEGNDPSSERRPMVKTNALYEGRGLTIPVVALNNVSSFLGPLLGQSPLTVQTPNSPFGLLASDRTALVAACHYKREMSAEIFDKIMEAELRMLDAAGDACPNPMGDVGRVKEAGSGRSLAGFGFQEFYTCDDYEGGRCASGWRLDAGPSGGESDENVGRNNLKKLVHRVLRFRLFDEERSVFTNANLLGDDGVYRGNVNYPVAGGIAPTITSVSKNEFGSPIVGALNRVNLLDTPTAPGTSDVVGIDSVKVTLQFFGWADHDQMPIRTVAVDWGDGTVSRIGPAKVQNHKPFCDIASDGTLARQCVDPENGFRGTADQATCLADEDCRALNPVASCQTQQEANDRKPQFGNSTDACINAPFVFSHTYRFENAVGRLARGCSGFANRECRIFNEANTPIQVTVEDWWGTISQPATLGGTVQVLKKP